MVVTSFSVLLAVLAVVVVLRLCLEAAFGRDSAALPMRLMRLVTAPVVGFARALSPRIVPAPLVYTFAICWLLAARMVLYVVAAAMGIRTSLG